MLKMTDDERRAYEAGPALPTMRSDTDVLARYIERCKADERSLTDPDDHLPAPGAATA